MPLGRCSTVHFLLLPLCLGIGPVVLVTWAELPLSTFHPLLPTLVPRLVRRTAMAALAWTVYERMLAAMALKN